MWCGTTEGEILRIHIGTSMISSMDRSHTHIVSGMHLVWSEIEDPCLYTSSMDATIRVRSEIRDILPVLTHLFQRYSVVPPLIDRFTSEVDVTNHWEPVTGMFDDRNPLLSIKQAARYFPTFSNYSINSKVRKGIRKMRSDFMRQQIASVQGLSESGAVALWLYTLEGPLYRDLNARLRSQDWPYLETHYFPYMRILITAMQCLQTGVTRGLNRGVKRDVVGESAEKMYERGNRIVWWSFSSTTGVIDVLENEQFLGTVGKRTIFQITSSKGADISSFSYYGNAEAEFLLPPGTVLKVIGILRLGDLTIVQCEDDKDDIRLIV